MLGNMRIIDLIWTYITAGDKNSHTKKVVLAVSITVPTILVMLLAITYIYITKAKYKSKFSI
jgi:hypothetical protein